MRTDLKHSLSSYELRFYANHRMNEARKKTRCGHNGEYISESHISLHHTLKNAYSAEQSTTKK